jgi:hypothetical protein
MRKWFLGEEFSELWVMLPHLAIRNRGQQTLTGGHSHQSVSPDDFVLSLLGSIRWGVHTHVGAPQQYCTALSRLERLDIQRMFELTKMNMLQMGEVGNHEDLYC